jgi:hypothetical protein
MSFSRNNYDKDTYEKTIQESTGPGHYMINEPRPCVPCYNPDPTVRAGNFGGARCQNKELIDVDSELMGLNYKHSRCPTKMFPSLSEGFCKDVPSEDCKLNDFLGAEPTRISNGPCTLRGTGINRWAWLPCDEQDHPTNLPEFNRLQNSQIMAKDAHRACLPKLMDQSNSLPRYDPSKEKTQVYNYNDGMPKFIEYNNLRTCSELNRL